MKQQIGMLLQLIVLACLPVISYWQLMFGIPLVVMPATITAGVFVFWIGTRLRESK